MTTTLNVEKLEREVKGVYQAVAEAPDGELHFEMGRPLAEKLGYSTTELEQVPTPAVESFAGVGYHFDLAELRHGDDVLDHRFGGGVSAVMRKG
jgi:arsenite methyltransferase